MIESLAMEKSTMVETLAKFLLWQLKTMAIERS
jgi:hypothetical protein